MPELLSTGMDLPEQSTPFRGGLLDRSYDLPEGWENGVTVPFYGCGEPILRDKCISATDTPHRDSMQDFQPFPIEQGAACSTIGGKNLRVHARRRLDATTEWAVGRQLQQDVVGTGSPKLDDATSVGSVTDFVLAVALLEQGAADAGYGAEWFLHAPVFAAAFLRRYSLMDREGRTPAGGTWIISPGYEPPNGTDVRLWATGSVWADVDEAQVRESVHRRMNEVAAWGLRVGLVAFDPCLNLSVDVTGVNSE